jgi:hypothetical protein
MAVASRAEKIMSQTLNITHDRLTQRTSAERRQHLRYTDRLPVILRGVGTNGAEFEVETKLENHSGGGFYVRLSEQCVAPGARLFAVIQFATFTPVATKPPRVAVCGVVLRTELHPEGGCGMAVEFTDHRFI